MSGSESSIDPDAPGWVVGDVSRLRQILVNLVGNAVKFTPRGRVTIFVGKIADGPTPGTCVLEIKINDSGIGIPKDKLSVLFKPFSQVDSSTSRLYGGTGLGLAISRNLIELMGGTIAVQSTVGIGSTFTVMLPVTLATPVQVEVPAAVTPASLVKIATDRPIKILMVEDVHINRVLTTRVLSDLGHGADAVASGLECLEVLKTKAYDLILMDIQMPDMDGFTATERIRAAGESLCPQRPYICALTANVFAKDVAACYTSGMDDVISKPLRREALQEAIQRARLYLEARERG